MDVMFDEDLRCWLLEFNALPGLDTLDDEQREVLLDDVISLAVDPLLPPANPPPAFDDASTDAETIQNGFVTVSEASVGWRPTSSPDLPVLVSAAEVAAAVGKSHQLLQQAVQETQEEHEEVEERADSSGDEGFDSVDEEEGASDDIILDEDCEERGTEALQVAALSALEERQAGLAWAGEPPDDWIS